MNAPEVSALSWPAAVTGFNLTLDDPAWNLALDDVLLNQIDVRSEPDSAYLRFCEPQTYFVVLGRSNRPETEVDLGACSSDQIPVFRRSSGGGTVLVGPGCLCYSLVLPLSESFRQAGISTVTTQLMQRTAKGLSEACPGIEVRGVSDLVYQGQKISGNAQRWVRNAFIHHGTILYDFPLELIEKYLQHPTREPEYRQSRSHRAFLENLPISGTRLKQCLLQAWNATESDSDPAFTSAARDFADKRYAEPEWRIPI